MQANNNSKQKHNAVSKKKAGLEKQTNQRTESNTFLYNIRVWKLELDNCVECWGKPSDSAINSQTAVNARYSVVVLSAAAQLQNTTRQSPTQALLLIDWFAPGFTHVQCCRGRINTEQPKASAVFTCIGALGTPSRTGPLAS